MQVVWPHILALQARDLAAGAGATHITLITHLLVVCSRKELAYLSDLQPWLDSRCLVPLSPIHDRCNTPNAAASGLHRMGASGSKLKVGGNRNRAKKNNNNATSTTTTTTRSPPALAPSLHKISSRSCRIKSLSPPRSTTRDTGAVHCNGSGGVHAFQARHGGGNAGNNPCSPRTDKTHRSPSSRKSPSGRKKRFSLPGGRSGGGQAASGSIADRSSGGSPTRRAWGYSGSSVMMDLSRRSGASRGQSSSSSGSGPRQSFRIRRQPSTYGELHELVATKKLGTGAVRGLGGEF